MLTPFAIASEKKPFLRMWETALLLALCVTLLLGLLAGRSQQKLASGLIRLHVIAASDSAEDQQTKLRVRDAVLDALTPELDSAASPQQAQAIIEVRLTELAAIGEKISGSASRATLGWENYPTRQYEGFALPAGRYLSLRIELGEAQGQNWWCVVFPPLCSTCVDDAEDVSALLDGKTAALITGESEGYVIKFRILEFWGALCARFGE